MTRSIGITLALAVLAGALTAPVRAEDKAPVPRGFFRLTSSAVLPGPAPDWDYLSFDAARGRLFIARRDAGLWVYDTRRHKLLHPVAMTDGAGASLLVPALGRGFATNEDGSVTVFDLVTLRALKRIKFADDADAATYDPVTGRIAFVSADSRSVTFMDAHSLRIVGHLALAAAKADGAVADGEGGILLNQRDLGTVARIDVASGKIVAEWPIKGCSQPTGIAYDAADHRALIGCRGALPVMAVVDTRSGATVAALPLGHGNDGVAYDPARHRILTTNGVEGNIVIYHQDDADHYRMEQAITTRPSARTLAYDAASQTIFTVTAQGVVNPAAPVNTGPSAFYPNAYYDNTFTVLSYRPGP